jgi:hypothetical protein
VGKWKSRSDSRGGLGRRLFHNLILSPDPTPEALSYMAGWQVITHGRIGVITEVISTAIAPGKPNSLSECSST